MNTKSTLFHYTASPTAEENSAGGPLVKLTGVNKLSKIVNYKILTNKTN